MLLGFGTSNMKLHVHLGRTMYRDLDILVARTGQVAFNVVCCAEELSILTPRSRESENVEDTAESDVLLVSAQYGYHRCNGHRSCGGRQQHRLTPSRGLPPVSVVLEGNQFALQDGCSPWNYIKLGMYRYPTGVKEEEEETRRLREELESQANRAEKRQRGELAARRLAELHPVKQ